VPFALLIKPQKDVMLNGQTFSSRTGKTSGLPKFELFAGSESKKTKVVESAVHDGFTGAKKELSQISKKD